MTSDDIGAVKAEIRTRALARRDALDPQWRARVSADLARSAKAIVGDGAGIVAAFWPIRSEIDPRPLMERLTAMGAELALPAVIDRQTIAFRRYRPGDRLERGSFGTMAPGPGAETVDPDMLLMPLAAFDAAGNRLGYGAGHYDRAIARLRQAGRDPRLVGLAFSCQRETAIPAEAHDVPLHAVVTEQGLQALATPPQRNEPADTIGSAR
ncbi:MULTISPECIES: 5-formyltetrahydrofolate cyclo-ligase [unclassified Roseitalea]|uniref:5-formyltetrahydrofolate cyclo-ligase n=1 Tax=unclassified Roseitalea TaxID=2639107 RepID=UPI0032088BA1